MPSMLTWKNHYWYSVPIMRARIEKIVELANPQGKDVLEVGCNEGFVSAAISEAHARSVIAMDYNIEMCHKATDLFGLKSIQGDINNIPYPDKSFDVVLGCEVLEHISNPFKGLSELFRVARERVVITVPVGEYWAGELTHQWMLFGGMFSQNNLQFYSTDKDILILCFHRIRNEDFVDIAPFNTRQLKDKYAIP